MSKNIIIPFYSHNESHYDEENKYKVIFSNFYNHKKEWLFIIPEKYRQENIPFEFMVNTSEKAIMIFKAILMKDNDTLNKILKTYEPSKIKALGRKVTPFDDILWNSLVNDIAYNVLKQKFNNPELKTYLLSTGDAYLVEASKRDKSWGVGIDINDPRIYDIYNYPKNSNILGLNLMQVRDEFKLQN